jgi:hypothetical protein
MMICGCREAKRGELVRAVGYEPPKATRISQSGCDDKANVTGLGVFGKPASSATLTDHTIEPGDAAGKRKDASGSLVIRSAASARDHRAEVCCSRELHHALKPYALHIALSAASGTAP